MDRKKKCFHANNECDSIHRLHTYHDFRGNKIVSCMFHKPLGWRRV